MNTEGVILAAGLSSRMGKNKMTLKIGGKTVIERCMGALYDSCSRIIVVTGIYHEDIKGCLTHYSKVHIVYNEDSRQGMFGSVKAGVTHVVSERFFITPGDYPFVKTDTIIRMIRTSGRFIAPVYKGRQGHPILLDKLFIPSIIASDKSSLRHCLHGTPVKGLCVDDIGVITDIDTMDDYKAVADWV